MAVWRSARKRDWNRIQSTESHPSTHPTGRSVKTGGTPPRKLKNFNFFSGEIEKKGNPCLTPHFAPPFKTGVTDLPFASVLAPPLSASRYHGCWRSVHRWIGGMRTRMNSGPFQSAMKTCQTCLISNSGVVPPVSSRMASRWITRGSWRMMADANREWTRCPISILAKKS